MNEGRRGRGQEPVAKPEGGLDRRASVWIHPAIPLQFGFDEAEPPASDRLTPTML